MSDKLSDQTSECRYSAQTFHKLAVQLQALDMACLDVGRGCSREFQILGNLYAQRKERGRDLEISLTAEILDISDKSA